MVYLDHGYIDRSLCLANCCPDHCACASRRDSASAQPLLIPALPRICKQFIYIIDKTLLWHYTVNVNGDNKPAIRHKTAKRGGKTSGSWKPGQSGNPAGRPSLGESYREIFSKVGNLTIGELREFYPTYGNRFESIDGNVKLKELVSLSVLVALACEPTPGMLATLLDRTDGPLEHTINVNKMSDEELANAIGPVLARLGIRIEPPIAAGMESNAEIGQLASVDASPGAASASG